MLELRLQRKLGAKQLSNEFLRLHGISLSPPTIQKILNRSSRQDKLESRLKWY